MKNSLEFWMSDYLDISCLRSTYCLHCCGINYCVSACKWCNGIQKLKSTYVHNVLHIKLVKLQSIWKSSSGRICHSKYSTPTGLEKINPVQPYSLSFLWHSNTECGILCNPFNQYLRTVLLCTFYKLKRQIFMRVGQKIHLQFINQSTSDLLAIAWP